LECGAASPLCVGHWDFVWDFGTLDLGFDSMNLNAMGRVKAVDFRRTCHPWFSGFRFER
jgi:hypothetical protein